MAGDDAAPEQLAGRLFVVATPIGNLGDLSSRAADVLTRCDLVLAEDTRHTGRLLAHLGPRPDGTGRTPLLSMHEHNEEERTAAVLERLRAGEAIALVSDAGTPAVSDPGHRLVRACAEAGLPVVPVPGPSAVLAALVASGLATDRFTFEGFLPRKGRARAERLAQLATEPRTMVLFASPHRAGADLADLAAACGPDRPGTIARELTKLHEQFVRGNLAELAEHAAEGLRGEVVLVVAGAGPSAADPADAEELARRVVAAIAAGRRSKDAIAEVAAAAGVPKKVAYQAFLDFGATGSSSTTT